MGKLNRLFSPGILAILLLSILPLYHLILNADLLHTHDGLVHLPRIAAFFKSLLDGHIPVRWAGELNYGYGMPIFIFIYHTPYLIASMFVSMGLGLVAAFKLSLASAFILSGIGMYMFAYSLFKDWKKALLAAVFYQFASFHLIDLLVRGSFGEVYTYAFLPFVMYSLIKFYQTQKFRFFLLGAISTLLLIISHNSVSLLYFGIAALSTFFLAPSRKLLIAGLFMLLVGLLASSYYWIPAVREHQYTYGDLFMKELYTNHFVPLHLFFIPNFTYDKALTVEGIPMQFGLFQTISLLLGIIFLMRNQKKDNFITYRVTLFSFALIALSLFFMTSLSAFFWENISLLRQFQFPWRFLAITVFATSLLSTHLFRFEIFKKKLAFWLLISSIALSSYAYWQPQEGFDKIDEKYYWNFPLTTTYYGETDIIWSAGPAKKYPKKTIEIIAGNGTISNVQKKTQRHTFTIVAREDVRVVNHTQYFPGWRVSIDNKPTEIQFQDPSWRGEITFAVPQGTHQVDVRFEESKTRLLANVLSVGSLGLLIAFFFIHKRWYAKK